MTGFVRTAIVTIGAGLALVASVEPVEAQLVISEFRVRGPNGANDEFIELYNNSGADHTVVAASGTGYGVAASDGTTRCSVRRVGSTSEANTLYKEGTGYPALTPFSIDYSFYRDDCGKSGSITTHGRVLNPTPKDTDNNAADFIFVDTNGTSAGAGQRLGAPGPQNLSSPIQRNVNCRGSPGYVRSAPVAAEPVRDFTTDPRQQLDVRHAGHSAAPSPTTPAATSPACVSGSSTHTFPAPSGYADLRPLLHAVVVTVDRPPCGSGTSNVTVQGTTLEHRPPAERRRLQLLDVGRHGHARDADRRRRHDRRAVPAGIQQTGTFKFYLNVEALP